MEFGNEIECFGRFGWEVMVSEKWQWSAIVYRALKTHPLGGFVVAGNTNEFPAKARVGRYSDKGELLRSQVNFESDYGYNKFNTVAVNSDGKVFVGGIVHHNFNSRQSALVAKVDTAGAIEWQKVLYSGYLTSGDSLMGEITSLLPTADGGCIAGGFESAKGKWGGWALLHKFSEADEIQWTKRYFYTGDDFQDAKVIGLSALPSSNNFMVYAHRDWGNTTRYLPILIAENNAIEGTTYDQLVLPSNTFCYFRVREMGIKGFPGSWSEVRKFTTGVQTGNIVTDYKPYAITYDKPSQQLKITGDDELEFSKVKLYDSSGRLCGSYRIDTNPALLTVKEFKQGVYILK